MTRTTPHAIGRLVVCLMVLGLLAPFASAQETKGRIVELANDGSDAIYALQIASNDASPYKLGLANLRVSFNGSALSFPSSPSEFSSTSATLGLASAEDFQFINFDAQFNPAYDVCQDPALPATCGTTSISSRVLTGTNTVSVPINYDFLRNSDAGTTLTPNTNWMDVAIFKTSVVGGGSTDLAWETCIMTDSNTSSLSVNESDCSTFTDGAQALVSGDVNLSGGVDFGDIFAQYDAFTGASVALGSAFYAADVDCTPGIQFADIFALYDFFTGASATLPNSGGCPAG
ncbi:MAG: hypothetical protein AAF752_14805, partial [Bacteroidota bacterium]